MKFEYIGAGGIFFGVGITIALAVPPPWWPKMPPTLIQAAVIFGFAFAAAGFAIMALGVWPAMPEPRAPISLTFLGLSLSFLGAGWWILAPGIGARTFSASSGALSVIHDTGQSTSVGREIEADRLTLHDLFANDVVTGSVAFFEGLSTKLYFPDRGPIPVSFEIGIFSDFVSHSQFMSFYLPNNQEYTQVLRWFAKSYKDYLHDAKTNLRIWSEASSGETQPSSQELLFTKTIYIYHEDILSDAEKFDIEAAYRAAGLNPIFRGFNYLQFRRKYGPGVKIKPSKPMPPDSGLILPGFSPDPDNEIDPSILTLFMVGFEGDGKGLQAFEGVDIQYGLAKDGHAYKSRVFPLIYFDKTHNLQRVALYIPSLSVTPVIMSYAAIELKQWLQNMKTETEKKFRDTAWLDGVIFDRNVYVYSEADLDDAALASVSHDFQKQGLNLVFRSKDYQMNFVHDISTNKVAKPPRYIIKEGVPVLANSSVSTNVPDSSLQARAPLTPLEKK